MLYTKILLAVLLGLALQGDAHENKPGECFCGIPNRNPQTRIAGGDEADIGEYPWQVYLASTYGEDSYACGGTLVGKRHIVTAAHCVELKGYGPADKVEVYIGFTHLTEFDGNARLIYEAEDVIIHPNYDLDSVSNDIAVLVLSDSALDLYDYPHIKPACLPKPGVTSEDFVGYTCTVTGWGAEKFAGPGFKHLREAELDFIGKNCNSLGELPVDRFCAGVPNGQKSVCHGDSGGPLVVNDPRNNGAMTLIGVSSYVLNGMCSHPEFPPVFADVTHYMQNGWLMDQLQGLETCDPPNAA